MGLFSLGGWRAPGAGGRLRELDALRGLAALMVVVFHCAISNPAGGSSFLVGTAGVDLFFIISGFVIFMSLQKVATGREFVRNRISRLYPGYWAAVTFTYGLMLLNPLPYPPPGNWKNYVINLTMVQAFFKEPDIDGPYWTLLIELEFYALVLLLYKTRLLNYLELAGAPLLLGVVLVIRRFPEASWLHQVLYWVPLAQFLALFLAGICFYKLYTAPKKQLTYYFLAAFYVLCQFLLFSYIGRSRHYISHQNYGIMLVLFYSAFALFVNGWLGFLINRATIFLGKISYALYLIHQYLATRFIIPFLLLHYHLNFWAATFGIAVPAAVLLATLLTYGVEIPAGRYLKRLLTDRTG